MNQGKATLVLDFGNSETRGILLFGRDATTGKLRERAFRLSNRFNEVEEGFVLPQDYDEETSTVLRVEGTANGAVVSGMYVNGEVQQKEYNVAPIRPSAIEKKYNAITTVMSYELAVLHAYKAIQRMLRTSSITELDITWDIVVLLPPGDVDLGREKMVELIKSVGYVDATYPQVRMPITVNRITVLPEGFCAYIGAVYDRGKVIRKEMEYLTKEVTLVCDIGAGTTDILIVSKGGVINTSKFTINRGGNNVIQLVRSALRAEGITLSETEIAEGIINGYVRDGVKTFDLTEILAKAKKEIAQQLVADMQGYLEETQFPIRSIARILVCGGGAMSSENSKSLGDSILEYLRKLAPNVELVELPFHEILTPDEDGVMHKEKVRISPRDLNVLGASIFGEMY